MAGGDEGFGDADGCAVLIHEYFGECVLAGFYGLITAHEVRVFGIVFLHNAFNPGVSRTLLHISALIVIFGNRILMDYQPSLIDNVRNQILTHIQMYDCEEKDMKTTRLLHRTCSAILASILMFLTTSCGTLLYPDRIGQSSGRIDPAVAILDGVGLLLFFIPGAVAFAVDFSTGAIYLSSVDDTFSNKGVLAIQVDPEQLDKACIERILQEQTGMSVDICSANAVVTRLEGPQATMATVAAWLRSNRTFAEYATTYGDPAMELSLALN